MPQRNNHNGPRRSNGHWRQFCRMIYSLWVRLLVWWQQLREEEFFFFREDERDSSSIASSASRRRTAHRRTSSSSAATSSAISRPKISINSQLVEESRHSTSPSTAEPLPSTGSLLSPPTLRKPNLRATKSLSSIFNNLNDSLHDSSSEVKNDWGLVDCLPDEIWEWIFTLANFESCIPQVCKRWHRIFWQTFRFVPGELRWRKQLCDGDEKSIVSSSKATEKRLMRLARAIHVFIMTYNRSCLSLFPDEITATKAFLLAVRAGDVAVTTHFWKNEKRLRQPELELAAWVARYTDYKPMQMLFEMRGVNNLNNSLPAIEGHADVIVTVLFSHNSEFWKNTKNGLRSSRNFDDDDDDAASPRMWTRGDTALIAVAVVTNIIEALGFVLFTLANLLRCVFDVSHIIVITLSIFLLALGLEVLNADYDQLVRVGGFSAA